MEDVIRLREITQEARKEKDKLVKEQCDTLYKLIFPKFEYAAKRGEFSITTSIGFGNKDFRLYLEELGFVVKIDIGENEISWEEHFMVGVPTASFKVFPLSP